MKITKDSHVDHSLSQEHLDFILEKWGDVEEFKIETVELPEHLASLPCGLYGPLMGDTSVEEYEVVYEVRGNREGKSRMVHYNPRMVRTMTVIMGPHEGECILYTAFGGPCAPREPFDSSLDEEGKKESEEFWSQHALAK